MKSSSFTEPSREYPSTSYSKKLSGSQISRSRQGCMTCRTRRVKCDEKHSVCGPCSRLQRECVWTRTWKFEDCTSRVHSGYTKTGQSSPNALEASSKIWDRMIERRSIAQQNTPSPSTLNSDEYKATMCAPGTVNILLTSAEFARRPEYTADRPSLRKSLQARSQEDRKIASSFNDLHPKLSPLSAPGSLETYTGERSWSTTSYSTESRRDSIGIHLPFPTPEYEDQAMELSGFAKLEVTPPEISSFEPMPYRMSVNQRSSPPMSNSTTRFSNAEDRISEDDDHLLMLYESVVCKRILPLAFKFGLNRDSDKNDIIVLAAREFPPLHHAVCAITLLSLALQGRAELLEGAFHHYQEAISSIRLHSDNIQPDHLFYLHSILLLYDGYCKHRGWPHDPRILGQHIRHIFESMQRQHDPIKTPLQRHMLLNMLLMGIESSFTGDEESAAFVGEFKANWSQLVRSPQESAIYATPFDGVVAEVQDLRLRVYRFAADISHIASGMRRQARAYRSSVMTFQDTIDILSIRLKKDCSAACLQYLIATDLETADCGVKGPNGEAIGCHSFDTAKVQYLALKLFLHTSMYSGQRMESARFAEEDALNCFRVLTIISAIVKGDYAEVFSQLLGPLFIAGCTTKVPEERELAMELMKTITATSCMPSIVDHVEMLALVHQEQMRRETCLGGRADEVDWIDLAQEKEKALFGFCFM